VPAVADVAGFDVSRITFGTPGFGERTRVIR
jgi:hypothetical protein